MGTSNDVPVASGSDEDVGTGSSILHGGDLVPGHGGLESVDGVNLGDQNASTIGLKGFGALKTAKDQKAKKGLSTYSLTDVTESSDDSDLAREHDICSTLDSVDEGLAASVVVVKFGLGDGVVDVDGGDLEFTVTESLVEVVDASSSLLRDTADL